MQSVFPMFVSSGRTGLTLLRLIFDSHPELAVAHEPRFLVPMAGKHRRYERGGEVDVASFVEDLYGFGNFRRLGIPEDDVRAALADVPPADFAAAVRSVFGLYAASRGKRLYANKSPLSVTFLAPLGQLFPEARFVHLVRDGRDVALAYLERDKGPSSVAEAAFHWHLRVARGRRSGERLGPDRYREYRYEDLIDDPEATVRDICRFLELDYHPQMLDYGDAAAGFLAEAKHPEDHQHLALAPTKGLIDWRVSMSPQDLAMFEAIGGDLLEELGYERAAEKKVPAPVVWWERIRWRMGRVIWRLKWKLGRR